MDTIERMEGSADVHSLVVRIFLFDAKKILGPDDAAGLRERNLDGTSPRQGRFEDARRQLDLLASDVRGLHVGSPLPWGVEAWSSALAMWDVLPSIETFARHLGLAWYLPELHEVGYPLALDEGDSFASALAVLAEAGTGWAILEAGDGLEHYVQVALPGDASNAHVEAVSNRHLPVGARMSATALARLRLLGWRLPTPGITRNYWRSHAIDVEGERRALARIATRTLRDVYGHVDGDAIVIRART